MNIWLTGEGGSLAKGLARLLEDDKKLKILSAPETWKSRVSMHHGEKEVDILCGSYMSRVTRMLKEKPDAIIHFAAVVNTDKCEHSPKHCIDVNVEGTRVVLETAKELGCKLMYISTTATYDVTVRRPYDEDSAQNPKTIYGITKYAGELMVRNQNTVPYIIVRPCFILGSVPYDHSSQLSRIAMHGAIKEFWPEKVGKIPKVTLNPNNLKDYMPEEDFAKALRKMLLNWKTINGQVFNVSNENPRPMGDYFALLQEYAKGHGYATEQEWLPEADYMSDHVVSSAKLKFFLNWKQEHRIENKIVQLAQQAKEVVLEARARNGVLYYE